MLKGKKIIALIDVILIVVCSMIYISNDQFEIYIEIGIKNIKLEIDINEELQENVKDEYFDVEAKVKEIDANLINTYEELIELIFNFIRKTINILKFKHTFYIIIL